MRKIMRRTAWIVMGFAGVLAACEDDDARPNAPPTSPPATEQTSETVKAEDRFWTAMGSGDWAKTEELATTFKTLREKDPNDVRAVTMQALTNLWRVAESDRLDNPQQMQAIAQGAGPVLMDSFKVAHEKDPNNAVLTSFYAIFSIDFGTNLKNPGLVAQGRGLFAQAKAADAITGDAFHMLTLRNVPPSSPDFDAGLEAGWEWVDLCQKSKIDREAPDFEGWLGKIAEIDDFKGGRKFCGDTEKAPYAMRDMLLTLGDALVAKGKIEPARRAYLATHVLRDKPMVAAPPWPHADAIESRLTEDLSVRAKSYADPDPAKWAPMGTNPWSCTVCHSKSGK